MASYVIWTEKETAQPLGKRGGFPHVLLEDSILHVKWGPSDGQA